MRKALYTAVLCLLGAGFCLFVTACAIVNQARFGNLPQGDQLEPIQESPNYRDGEFKNLIPTPQFSKDVGTFSIILSGIFTKTERLSPAVPIPAMKTDLKPLSRQEDTVVWLGHSSWFIQVAGKRILIDPVFSGYASPFSFMVKAFDGTSIYKAGDMPEIDCLLISHDHWDHLDYETVVALRSKVKQVVCPLGVGAYLESWGYPKQKIREGDWYSRVPLGNDVTVHVLPARHYSGRLFKKNQTLWAGFAIKTPDRKIFYSGDTGYGPHFPKIGKLFKGFDLALLDCGQYDPRWAYIHMTPEEAARAAEDLGTKALIPAHAGRFAIANHPWDEPFKRMTTASQGKPFGLLTPIIGEPVALDGQVTRFSHWWEIKASNS
jgi:L-ascorbate metabolism protein UlaG (beta-lactamase superfamily)